MKRALFATVFAFGALLFADSVKDLLRVGDHFFRRGEYVDALKSYRRAEELAPDDPNVLWRVGAALNRIAMDIPQDKARVDTFKVANEYLTRALAEEPKEPKIHAELAWNLTFMGLLRPDWNNLSLAGRIKEELDYALSLDSSCAEAYFLYGIWHREVGKVSLLRRKPYGLGDASVDLALPGFARAAELEPQSALFWLELAKQSLFVGDTARAKGALEKAIEAPDLPANKPHKQKARDILESLRR